MEEHHAADESKGSGLLEMMNFGGWAKPVEMMQLGGWAEPVDMMDLGGWVEPAEKWSQEAGCGQETKKKFEGEHKGGRQPKNRQGS